MAIVKYGGLIQEIKGSVGGTTFRGSNSVKTVYNKVSGNTAYTNGIPNKISLTAYLQGQWRSLDSTDRESWNIQAPKFLYEDRFGNIKSYNGFQLFLKYNYGWRGQGNVSVVKKKVLSEDDPNKFPTNFLIGSNLSLSIPFSGGFGVNQFYARIWKLKSKIAYVGLRRSKIGIYSQISSPANFSSNAGLRFPWFNFIAGDVYGWRVTVMNRDWMNATEYTGRLVIS